MGVARAVRTKSSAALLADCRFWDGIASDNDSRMATHNSIFQAVSEVNLGNLQPLI